MFVRLSGELDLACVGVLRRALASALGRESLLVLVDMREVRFLDVAAARVLLDAQDAVGYEEGRMVVLRGPVAFDWWFPMLGFDGLLEVLDVR